MSGDRPAASQIDVSVPHPARVYDWFLGGKDNYVVDEELGKKVLILNPTVTNTVRSNRSFMHRATRWAAGTGIRQFLDIGTGIPTAPNLHQVAQRIAPRSRVVYADNDPIVLRHAEALLISAPEGATGYVEADVREPAAILERAAEILDFAEPVALSLVALMHFVSDEEDARGLVRHLMDALAPGSTLALSHVTSDIEPESAEVVTSVYREGGVFLRLRSRDEVAGFFEGLELVEPGLVLASRWRPEPDSDGPPAPEHLPCYAGVALKR